MRYRHTAAAFVFLAMVATPVRVLASPAANCVLPIGLREEVTAKYPDAHVLTVADLSDYDKKLFRKDFGARCPGLIRVNFYGDGKPTWALVLILGEGLKQTGELVVARRSAGMWDMRSLEKSDGAPVVWREGLGKYEGLNEAKPLHAKNSVVVLCWYGSSTILYAWMDDHVDKVWLSD
jgi:hypothetical protein